MALKRWQRQTNQNFRPIGACVCVMGVHRSGLLTEQLYIIG